MMPMLVTAAVVACLALLLLPPPSLGYTTISDAARSRSLWSSGRFAALVDVRRVDEWESGHLPNATLIPSLQESRDASRLEGCQDCPVAVYCHTGRRAARAAEVLEEKGFANVYNVLGIAQWIDVGIELVSEGERDPACFDASCPATANGGVGNAIGAAVVAIATVGAAIASVV
ncbi:hypothetical protein ACHAWF_006326 [Thalassiosira exigua]